MTDTMSTPAESAFHHPSALRMRVIMALVTGAMFMEILDGTIITTALPSMAVSFGTTAIELNLGISAYLLSLGVFIPASGWVADRFGARTVFAAAIGIFTLASVLCGMTSDLHAFIGLRIFQGMAGAMMVPVGRLVVLRFTPKEDLVGAISALVWPALIAPILGPPIGGFITTHWGWRWIFYINVPLGMLAFIATVWLIPNIRSESPRQFDWLGFVLCGLSSFTLLYSLEALTGATDAHGLVLLLVGLGLLWLAIRHLKRSPHPLIDLAPARIATMRVALRGGSFYRTAISSAPFLLPLFFQIGLGYDAFHAGLLVLALFAGNLGMKSIATGVLNRFGHRSVLIWNGCLCAFSIAICAALTPGWPLVLTVIVLIMGGMTRSMQFTTLNTLAYSDIPKSQMSDANSLFNSATQLSNAMAITLSALCVRAGQSLVEWASWPQGAEFRIAFLMMASFALLGLVDALGLHSDAASHLLKKSDKS
jgi:EmrB/QacA subfamily drug resistance transporter